MTVKNRPAYARCSPVAGARTLSCRELTIPATGSARNLLASRPGKAAMRLGQHPLAARAVAGLRGSSRAGGIAPFWLLMNPH